MKDQGLSRFGIFPDYILDRKRFAAKKAADDEARRRQDLEFEEERRQRRNQLEDAKRKLEADTWRAHEEARIAAEAQAEEERTCRAQREYQEVNL